MDLEIITSLSTGTLQDISTLVRDELKKRKRFGRIERRRKFVKTLDISRYSSHIEANAAIHARNRSLLLALPNLNGKPHERTKYIDSLIRQDWSAVYGDGKSTKGDFYVYAHVHPGRRIFVTSQEMGGNYGGEPFYIGKGVGDRAYDLKRNQGHGKILRQAMKEGWEQEDLVHIVFNDLNENKAFELEAKLVYFFGSVYEKGRKQGVLYNLDLPTKPLFVGEMQKITFARAFDNHLSNHGMPSP